jgi:hypothetical protein
MRLLITGCVRCGAYSSSIDGVCDACRSAHDPGQGARADKQRARRIRVRKRGS